MNYICDTAGKTAYCARCLTAKPHECRPLNYFHCSEAGESVRCDLIEETHTCYYCDHTGVDVNRIACTSIFFNHAMDEHAELPNYCCDDGIMCDERWQGLQEGKAAEPSPDMDCVLDIQWPADVKIEPQCFPFLLAFQDISHTTVVVAWALKEWLERDDESPS